MAVRIVEGAWSGNISERSDSGSHLALMPSEGKTLLAWQYAKYKNRPFRCHGGGAIFCRSFEWSRQIAAGN
jgi:hypothetical protein